MTEAATSTEIDRDVRAGLYLTFVLAEEMYGIQILAVQEIIQLIPTTAVPRTPEYVRGVVNLRGKVIPVVDLRSKFGMGETEDTPHTCIVVVQVSSGGGELTMGIVVDQVAEVLEVGSDQIEPPPSFGSSVDTSFLLGVGKVEEKVVMLLDVERVLVGDDGALVAQLAEAAAPQ